LTHGRPLVLEQRVGDALRHGIHLATDAARQADAALEEPRRPVKETLDHLLEMAALSAQPQPSTPDLHEGFETGERIFEQRDGTREELIAFAATYERLKQRGCGIDELADFAAAYRFLKDHGCREEEALLFFVAYEFVQGTELQDSFTGAYCLLKERGLGGRDVVQCVATRLALADPGSFLAAWVHDDDAALRALEAYFEAAGIWSRLAHEVRPKELVPVFLYYYGGRRSGDRELLEAASAQLLSADGPLYPWALRRYKRRAGLWDTDREVAADAYCREFLRVLDYLPVEALLCPGLALAYLLKSAERAGNKTLPLRPGSELSAEQPNRDSSPSLSIEDDDDDELWARIRSLPYGDLGERRYRYGQRASLLAAEYGVSRQTIYDRLDIFGDAYGHFLATGEACQARGTVPQAMHWLEAMLKDGPRPAGELIAKAGAARISKTTLYRAKTRLGIESHKPEFRLGWIWSLPQDSGRSSAEGNETA